MKPIGKTVLVKCDPPEDIAKEKNIYIVNLENDPIHSGFWKGVLIAYGTTVTEKDLIDMPKIGETVVMDISKKSILKAILGKKAYYVRNLEDIVGVIEDDQ